MNANNLTRQIIKYCNLNGHFAFRASNTPAGTRRSNVQTKGVADILGCTKDGLALAIEVKIGDDKQSEEQKVFEKEYKKRGGVYIVARKLEDITEII